MKDKDYIQELFSQKLSNHEVPVRSDLWSGIQSQIGSTATTAASGGISVAAKWVIGIVASAVVTTGAVVWLSSDESTEQKPVVQISHVEQKSEAVDSKKETAVINPSVSVEQSASVQDGNHGMVSAQNQIKTDRIKPVAHGSAADNKDVYTPLIVKQQSPNAAPAVSDKTENASTAAATRGDQKNPAGSAASSEASTSGSMTNAKPVVGKVEEWVDVFTPNNDGANDKFSLKTKNLKDFSITVMDSKSQVVYKSADPDFVWEGIDIRTNEMVPDGNYIYMIASTDTNGNAINKIVKLTIKR